MKNTIRITSGKFRGRAINTPGGKTHPMGERERLALFNMISEYVPSAVVLDAYAGSGALGFEALSRGAAEVLFIDNSPEAERCIMKNMMALGYFEYLGDSRMNPWQIAQAYEPKLGEIVNVMRIRISRFESDRMFDLILADPPYNAFDATGVTHLARFLKPQGIFVLSHPGEAPEIDGLRLLKSRKYASASISVYARD